MANSKEYMRDYMLRRYYRRKSAALEYLGGKCLVCGTTEELEFDHIDPSTKKYTLARILTSGSNELLQEELEKCQLLCSKHHLEKSLREGDLGSVEHGGGLTGKKNCYCALCKPLKLEYNRKRRKPL